MSNTRHVTTSTRFRESRLFSTRKSIRLFARLTSAFRKKVGNHAAVAVLGSGVLYNFCRALRSDGFRLKAGLKCARLVFFTE